MTTAYPITVTPLLEECDQYTAHEMRVQARKDARLAAVQRIVSQLTERGVTVNQFMVSCDVVDALEYVNLDEDVMSLPVYVALHGEDALNTLIAANTWGDK